MEQLPKEQMLQGKQSHVAYQLINVLWVGLHLYLCEPAEHNMPYHSYI